jgi:hypothetical protein
MGGCVRSVCLALDPEAHGAATTLGFVGTVSFVIDASPLLISRALVAKGAAP